MCLTNFFFQNYLISLGKFIAREMSEGKSYKILFQTTSKSF